MFELLPLTLEELWAIRDHVRQTDQLGREWDKDFMVRVHAGILEAQENAARTATMLIIEDELWQLDRQIPSTLMAGTQPVGRNLLVKVARLLVKYRRGSDEHDDAGTDSDQGS